MAKFLVDVFEMALPTGLLLGAILYLFRMPTKAWAGAIDAWMEQRATETVPRIDTWLVARVRQALVAIYGARMRTCFARSLLFNVYVLLTMSVVVWLSWRAVDWNAFASESNSLSRASHPLLQQATSGEIERAVAHSNAANKPLRDQRKFIYFDARSLEIRAALNESLDEFERRKASHPWRSLFWLERTSTCASRLLRFHVCYAALVVAVAIAGNVLLDTSLMVLFMRVLQRSVKWLPGASLALLFPVVLALYFVAAKFYYLVMQPDFNTAWNVMRLVGWIAWPLVCAVVLCCMTLIAHRQRLAGESGWVRWALTGTLVTVIVAMWLYPAVANATRLAMMGVDATPEAVVAPGLSQPGVLVHLNVVVAGCALIPSGLVLLFGTVSLLLYVALLSGQEWLVAAYRFATRDMGTGPLGAIVLMVSLLVSVIWNTVFSG